MAKHRDREHFLRVVSEYKDSLFGPCFSKSTGESKKHFWEQISRQLVQEDCETYKNKSGEELRQLFSDMKRRVRERLQKNGNRVDYLNSIDQLLLDIIGGPEKLAAYFVSGCGKEKQLENNLFIEWSNAGISGELLNPELPVSFTGPSNCPPSDSVSREETPIQQPIDSIEHNLEIKWLHRGKLRRFELGQSTFASLIHEIRTRVPTFDGTLCYYDDQEDELVIENDADLNDACKFSSRIDESVLRIHSSQQYSRDDDDKVENGQSGVIKTEQNVIEIEESGGEGEGAARHLQLFTDSSLLGCQAQSQSCPPYHQNSTLVSTGQNWCFGTKKPRLGDKSLDSTDHRGEGQILLCEQSKKRKMNNNGPSNTPECAECGERVAGNGTCLKMHVNLHHLKLPIFVCKLCGKTEYYLQKTRIINHIAREHPRANPEENFQYNYALYADQLQEKVDQCFGNRMTSTSQQQH